MHASRRAWSPIQRLTWRKFARVAELLLCAVLIFGLFPGNAEIVETVAHLVHDGHLPHSDTHDQVAATEDCDTADEHGCTPLAHHCKCCVSAAAIPPRGVKPEAEARAPRDLLRLPHNDRGPPNHAVKPYLPPPIA